MAVINRHFSAELVRCPFSSHSRLTFYGVLRSYFASRLPRRFEKKQKSKQKRNVVAPSLAFFRFRLSFIFLFLGASKVRIICRKVQKRKARDKKSQKEKDVRIKLRVGTDAA